MKRRDFLKTGGIAGTAGLILDGCGKPQQLIPLLVGEDRFVPGEEGWVRTLCQQCSAGCGITVRVMQGESIRTIDGQQKRVKAVQAKKIEGNPEHPISMGGTCARGQAGVQVLYHPDRIQTPLKLSGPRGSGQYQPITWKEAQQLLVTQLQQQQATPAGGCAADRPAEIAARWAQSSNGSPPASAPRTSSATTRSIRRRFARRWSSSPACRGCPRWISRMRTTCSRSTPTCSRRSSRPCATSIRTAICVRDGPGIRGAFVQAEPRLSQTAACADEWLPIKPGTEGLLALAIAHVIVNEKLYDAEFVGQNTSGFRRVVGIARRVRAGEDRGADRCARRIHSARGARVCQPPSERRRGRQPRRRLADGDLCAECTRRRIRTAWWNSVRGR